MACASKDGGQQLSAHLGAYSGRPSHGRKGSSIGASTGCAARASAGTDAEIFRAFVLSRTAASGATSGRVSSPRLGLRCTSCSRADGRPRGAESQGDVQHGPAEFTRGEDT